MMGFVWGEYRKWAKTSRERKTEISNTSLAVLVLMLIGTALGTLTPVLKPGPEHPGLLFVVGKVLPWLAALALGIATYLTSQLLAPSERLSWVKARAAAEALKSEAFKYATRVPPYDTPERAALLEAKSDEITGTLQSIEPSPLTDEERGAKIPADPLPPEEYRRTRGLDQLDFYTKGFAEHRLSARRERQISLVLGGIAVVLSATTASWEGAGVGAVCAAVLGIVTTASASIAVWFQSGHHQQVAAQYQAALTRLQKLMARHAGGAVSFEQLVTEAEAIFQAEHAAWRIEWESHPAPATVVPAPAAPAAPTAVPPAPAIAEQAAVDATVEPASVQTT